MNETVPEVEEKLPADVQEGEDAAQAQAPAESEAGEAAVGESQDSPAEPPMVWHRFLTNFWLWVEALYHALQAVWMLLGGQYYAAELREAAYAGLPKLRMLDWALAGVAGVAAVLCALSAIALRKRRRFGPGLLGWTYVLLAAGQLGLAAGRWFIVGLTPLAASTLGPLVVYLVLLLVNGAYYRRRRSCFAQRNQTEGH